MKQKLTRVHRLLLEGHEQEDAFELFLPSEVGDCRLHCWFNLEKDRPSLEFSVAPKDGDKYPPRRSMLTNSLWLNIESAKAMLDWIEKRMGDI